VKWGGPTRSPSGGATSASTVISVTQREVGIDGDRVFRGSGPGREREVASVVTRAITPGITSCYTAVAGGEKKKRVRKERKIKKRKWLTEGKRKVERTAEKRRYGEDTDKENEKRQTRRKGSEGQKEGRENHDREVEQKKGEGRRKRGGRDW